ncbi:hypothetical protein [Nitrosophilus kaiyonis]|uniref:hypothetical protein n=1 Tax=Nitrosophilus kaiyonis TaxID=2930200 RepID=UPI00248FB07C|nr:hypothetical protein [Nitrosophilus kaiyonis]
MNKKFFILLFIIFLIFNYLYPKPKKEKIVVNDILFAKPLFFRALTNYTHTLSADKLWLLSNTVGEVATGNSFDVDEMEVYEAFKTIIFMDPYFYPAINYAATYLASIKKRVDLATDLIKKARLFNKNDFKLYFLELILILTYEDEKNIDDDYIVKLAKEASLLPDSQKILGRIVVKDWVEDMLIYARNKKGKRAQAIEDLKWLLKNTKEPVKKAEIKRKLEELKRSCEAVKG